MEQEMSRTFNHAYSAGALYDHDLAIKLYNTEIENNPTNFAAWNNRGVNKVHKGIADGNKDLIAQGLDDMQKAINLAKEADGKDFPIATSNMDWAKKELEKL